MGKMIPQSTITTAALADAEQLAADLRDTLIVIDWTMVSERRKQALSASLEAIRTELHLMRRRQR